MRNARLTVLSALLLSTLLGPSGVSAEGSGLAWETSVDAAFEAARADRRNILVDLWADWCTWCKRLDEEVFSTAEFATFAERFVLLRVDTEDGGEGAALKERFQVQSLPTTLILSPDEVRVGALLGFQPAPQYIQSLQIEQAMYQLLLRAYGETNDATDRDTLKAMADDFHDRQDGVRAADLFQKLLTSSEESPEEAAWNLYLLADSLRLSGDPAGATATRDRANRAALSADDQPLVELTDLLSYQIARDDHRCDDAATALESFVTNHPESQYQEQAAKALERILSGHCR